MNSSVDDGAVECCAVLSLLSFLLDTSLSQNAEVTLTKAWYSYLLLSFLLSQNAEVSLAPEAPSILLAVPSCVFPKSIFAAEGTVKATPDHTLSCQPPGPPVTNLALGTRIFRTLPSS